MPGPDGTRGVRLEQDLDRGRYVMTVDGVAAGFVDYRDREGVVWLDHAEVDPGRRGQGLGAELVERTLQRLRSERRAVVPLCGYVARYVREHPEHADLVPRGRGARPGTGTGTGTSTGTADGAP